MNRIIKSSLMSFVLAVLCLLHSANATKNSGVSINSYHIRLRTTLFYDNNALKYSDAYLNRFINRRDPGRFHIRTYDDMAISQSLRIGRTLRFWSRHKTLLSVEINLNNYVINPIKNWSYPRIIWRQSLARNSSFTFVYGYIHHFYVRHYLDQDRSITRQNSSLLFRPYEFSKDDFTFRFSQKVTRSTTFHLSCIYWRYFHNKYFTEYDSKNLGLGLYWHQVLHRKLKIKGGWQFMVAEAKGYDEPGETRENSDDADASYEQDSFLLACIWRLPARFDLNHNIELDLTYKRCYYRTRRPPEIDPLHAGRKDEYFTLRFVYSVRLNKNFSLAGIYQYNRRESDTATSINRELIRNAKNYNQQKVGLRATLFLNL